MTCHVAFSKLVDTHKLQDNYRRCCLVQHFDCHNVDYHVGLTHGLDKCGHGMWQVSSLRFLLCLDPYNTLR